MDIISQHIATTLGIKEHQVEQTLHLLRNGATIPFISRYRKEATGGLDEVAINDIKENAEKLEELIKRKETITTAIDKQGKLTPELRQKIESCWDSDILEDLYLPYKQKRNSRAEVARQKGLEPLAKIIMKQVERNLERHLHSFTNKEVQTNEEALKGARDIIAEWVNENEYARQSIRRIFKSQGILYSKVQKGKEKEGEKYADYFDYERRLERCPSHQLLAIRRGEHDGYLKVSIMPDEETALRQLNRIFIKADNECAEQVEMAIKDSYKRLLRPSIETEFAASSKEKADTEAIRVFAENLKQLLLAAPLGEKRILAIDPGYRTGCKVVCLDEHGTLLHNETIYPHAPQNEKSTSARKIEKLVEAYRIDAIAIGNGTAGRETEHFIQNLRYDHEIKIFSVSENGASVYSASKVAREEFPNYDVTVRGAVSIGRRLIDPLAELVKIDPKSVGVGQYQHDVDQTRLKNMLDQTVINVVNAVGVNVNTASKHLLAYISGLGPQLAQNIVKYREEHGMFNNRRELLKVTRMGEKAFEQCAGFLRISNGSNPLDNTAVHPERYKIVQQMAKDLGCNVEDLIRNKTLLEQINLTHYVNNEVGLPTLTDIIKELEKPGRDPRNEVEVFEFDPSVRQISDLTIGQQLPGIVTNITNFGAFVDIGIKENGLIHISNMGNRFVRDPNEILKLHQHIYVKVMDVDMNRKRIQLALCN